MKLEGKVALITGAGSGIGKAIAVRFAAEGGKVVINYHPGGKHSGKDVQTEIEKAGGQALALAANVDQRQEVDIPFPGYTAYCASKGAIRMMMRNLAMELAQFKINVNNIAPGAIATPINEPVLKDPHARQYALEEIPWGRFGKPEEIASVAAFLASAEADYITGSTYYIDGGLTQQVTKY